MTANSFEIYYKMKPTSFDKCPVVDLEESLYRCLLIWQYLNWQPKSGPGFITGTSDLCVTYNNILHLNVIRFI